MPGNAIRALPRTDETRLPEPGPGAEEGHTLSRRSAGVRLVQLERESLNSLFETLLLWENHLAQYDLSDLGCDDEHFG